MFRLGRLKAPRKVHAASCLRLQLSKENFGDPARIAVLSERLGDPARIAKKDPARGARKVPARVAKKVPARVAKKVPARIARREANTHPALPPSQHTRNSLKTIRVGTAHPSVKMTPFAPATRLGSLAEPSARLLGEVRTRREILRLISRSSTDREQHSLRMTA